MTHIRTPIKFQIFLLKTLLHKKTSFSAPNCVPSTNNVFLFAYSNDLDSSTVAAVRDGVVYDWAWQHDPIVGNVRFDVKQEEEIQFHRDVVSFNSSVSSHMPNPSLGYGDNTTDSDVFNVIQKFLNNSEAPICGAALYIIVKRYPGTNQINPLISQLQKNHVYVYYHVHSDPFNSNSDPSGFYRHAMFDMAELTNGFCIFGDDNAKTKEITTSARNGVGLINRPYQYISQRYLVQAGSGRIELPIFQSPNPNATKEQVLAVTTVEETPLDGRYLSLNYTVKSVDGTVLTTFPGGYWAQLGSGIINYFDMTGKVDYNWTIDYHYSAGRKQVIVHRVYGFYTVAAVRNGVVYDWAWQHDPIVGNVRFDVRQEEEIQFHRDVVSFNSSVSSRMPNPSLGYGDHTTDSDVFNVIQKFLNNREAPICGAVLYIIVKRYPGTDQTNPLVSQLQKNHVYVYFHVHSDPSGGQYRHVMFDMAAVTNGFCIFGDDNGKTKEFTTSARNGVGLINRPFQYISKRYVVQAGSGRIELPIFRSPNPNASKEQVLAVTTVEETPLDGNYLSLNYTVKSVDGTVLTTFPGGYWPQLGSGIINYFDMNGKVDYNWTIDYHYSAGRQQVIEHRVYGFYYHDFLPFAKIVP